MAAKWHPEGNHCLLTVEDWSSYAVFREGKEARTLLPLAVVAFRLAIGSRVTSGNVRSASHWGLVPDSALKHNARCVHREPQIQIGEPQQLEVELQLGHRVALSGRIWGCDCSSSG